LANACASVAVDMDSAADDAVIDRATGAANPAAAETINVRDRIDSFILFRLLQIFGDWRWMDGCDVDVREGMGNGQIL